MCSSDLADLREADLRRSQLPGVLAVRANLFMANLREVQWPEGLLSEADLQGALLAGADLRSAQLIDVRISGAELRGANLCGADLIGANGLTEEQLSRAQIDEYTRLPDQIS